MGSFFQKCTVILLSAAILGGASFFAFNHTKAKLSDFEKQNLEGFKALIELTNLYSLFGNHYELLLLKPMNSREALLTKAFALSSRVPALNASSPQNLSPFWQGYSNTLAKFLGLLTEQEKHFDTAHLAARTHVLDALESFLHNAAVQLADIREQVDINTELGQKCSKEFEELEELRSNVSDFRRQAELDKRALEKDSSILSESIQKSFLHTFSSLQAPLIELNSCIVELSSHLDDQMAPFAIERLRGHDILEEIHTKLFEEQGKSLKAIEESVIFSLVFVIATAIIASLIVAIFALRTLREHTMPLDGFLSALRCHSSGREGCQVLSKNINPQLRPLADIVNTLILELEETKREYKSAKKKAFQHAYKAGLTNDVLQRIQNIEEKISFARDDLISIASDKKQSLALENLEVLINVLKKENDADHLADFLHADAEGLQVLDTMVSAVVQLRSEAVSQAQALEKLNKALQESHDIAQSQDHYKASEQKAQEVALEEAFDKALDLMRPTLTKHSIAVSKDLDDELPSIFVEQTIFIQMLLELLQNACESIAAQKERNKNSMALIQIHAHRTADKMIKIDIQDSGIGFDPQTAPKFFSLGFSTKKEKLEDSGLGLFECKNFVEANSGRIQILSPGIGSGAQVTVFLPSVG